MANLNANLTMSDSVFSKLRAIIHKETGISIGDARKSMLVSRLRPRLRDVEASDFEAYVSQVSADPNEMQELINRVTTNETYFYRTPRIWAYFRETVVPEFIKKGQNQPMRVWSGAASTGEEGHTIGALLEEVRTTQNRFDYAVVGTDVSARVLKVAEEGVYRGRSVARFKSEEPELFAKHLQGSESDGYRLTPQAKSRVKFKKHNLMKPLKGERPFDVVFLRNVLIYFTREDQERILSHVHNQMHTDGILFIGESESLKQINTGFEAVAPLIYRPVSGTGRSCQ